MQLLIYCKRAPLELLEQIDYWVLNVSVYNVAYNFKRYLGDLKTQKKKKETPK